MGKIVKTCPTDNQHSGDVLCSTWWNGHLYTGGADGRVKIWDQDLTIVRDIQAHEAQIYAITVNPKNGAVYTSSSDGSIKMNDKPLDGHTGKVLVRIDDDKVVESLIFADGYLYSGDDKGVVIAWDGDKMKFKYHMLEEVRSLAVEDKFIYTGKGLDTMISQVIDGETGKYSNAACIPGKSPLALVGPIENGKRKYLVFATRDGKGIILVKNHVDKHFAINWTKEGAHEMIINAFVGISNTLYSAGYDGVVKRWTDLDASTPKEMASVTIGNCINTMIQTEENVVYVGCSNGLVYKLEF